MLLHKLTCHNSVLYLFSFSAASVWPYLQKGILVSRQSSALTVMICIHVHSSYVVCCRYKSRAGFVIWSRGYRWDFFCQQGFKAATGKLTQMLKAIGPLAATRAAASDQSGSQTLETQDLMSETKSLVTAMYSHFKSQLDHLSIPGFKTFEGLVLTLDLQWVYINLVEAKLSVSYLLLCVSS